MDIVDVKNLIKRVPKEHSIILLGPPGVGKTTVIRQIARELAHERGLEFAEYPRDKELVKSKPDRVFVFYPIPLTTRDVVELTGPLRVVRGIAKFVPMEDWEILSKAKDGILFLDEITNLDDDMLKIVFRLLEEHYIGDVSLKNLHVIGAGNRPEDNSISRPFPTPMVTKTLIFTVDAPRIERWINYISDKDVSPEFIGFITRIKTLYDSPESPEMLTPHLNPRSAERAARLVKDFMDVNEKYEIVKATIGEKRAQEFMAFIKLQTPPIEDFLNKKARIADFNIEQAYYIASLLLHYLKSNEGKQIKWEPVEDFMIDMLRQYPEALAMIIAVFKDNEWFVDGISNKFMDVVNNDKELAEIFDAMLGLEFLGDEE